ncbi:cation-translocating P-type ATPase [Tessaracoccus sp. ZS01]|uniref:cation-translocating P-type ATPase n=1 Tax=Tessaracoccus sp. ZS01 TaxID=1906324 RepID=UPI00096E9CE9|nr:cation-translocating P-type ATPase [Tessaracoccus sp. ZS01]MCG6568200.1 cation-translocating P-type ATPase [Tessaracoccus sp. ZS01]OMG53444.1 haloacid dehalogenase [Tessaracoccus sp. ZS01]
MTAPAYTKSAADVAAEIPVDPRNGLTSQEAAERLEEFGPNELRGAPEEPAWRRFLRQFADPLVYLLLVAIVISIFAWVAEGASGLPIDALVIAIIVVANAVLGFVQENKAENAVAALSDMTATHSTVLRDGRLTDVPSAGIVPGDILVLSEGDAVGADGRLLTASSLKVQEASLTGESEPVEKDAGTLSGEAALGDRLNMVFKGTAVSRGVGRAVVTGTGMDTEMGRIATLLDETQRDPSPLQQEIAKISKMLGLLVVVIAIVVMGAVALVNGVRSLDEAVDILLMGVSLAVAAVPEGLPAILSLVLAIGVQTMAWRNAVMKDLHSVETLGSVSVICSDKTGTLTRNEMTLREIVTASGRVKLSGTGYAPEGGVEIDGGDDAAAEARRLLASGVLANNAQLTQDDDGTWSIQGDPTEAAFVVAQHKLEGVTERVGWYERDAEAPFDSERKLMSVLGHREDQQRLFAKGAPDVLLERCVQEQVGRTQRPLTDERREELGQAVVGLSQQGYRTLGVAWREADDADPEGFDETAEHDLVWVGVVGIIDPPRDEAAQAIAEAHRAGIKTVMITGDHPVTAARIAQDLGITDNGSGAPRAVTGRDLEGLSDDELTELVRRTSVYARVSPEHKLRIVDALQADRQIVSMTGDGVNDAPALKSADIGIAMGITGTEVTKEAGEMILGDDNYATIVAAVRQGRVIFDNIKKFIRYLLSSNMGEVATVFLGVVLGSFIGLADPGNPGATVVPLLATQILWINLVTDSGPALAMGVDPEIDDVMNRKPRAYDDRIIDGHMWARIIGTGLVMGIISLVIYDLSLPGGFLSGLEHLVGTDQQLEVARTTVFTALVMMQLFNALNSRSDLGSAFSHLFTNAWLWVSLLGAALAQVAVVQVPFLQQAFGTTSLDLAHWVVAVGAGVAVLVYEEVVKVIRRAAVR